MARVGRCERHRAGILLTDMNRNLQESEEFLAWLERRVPARRRDNLDELAGAVGVPASPASDDVNGQMLDVDDGLLALA